MNSEELVEEFKKLLKDPRKKQRLLDIDEPTKYLDEYAYLWKAFENSKYRKYTRKFKFSQLVRAIAQPESEKLYMYDRLWSFLLDFRETPDDYFNIQTEWWHFNSLSRSEPKEKYKIIEGIVKPK